MITDRGIDTERLSPELGHLIGDLTGLAVEAGQSGQLQIEPIHFLVWLASQGSSLLSQELLQPNRVTPERLRELLYLVHGDQRSPRLPSAVDSGALSDASRALLDEFERRMGELGVDRGGEALFLLALFDQLPPAMHRALVTIAGSDELFGRLCASLKRRAGPPEPPVQLFDASKDDTVARGVFDRAGRRVLDRLVEETAGLGAQQAGTLHLLYGLVGIENGVLQRGLYVQNIDPMRDIHASLTRQLSRPHARRTRDFVLKKATLHEPLIDVLTGAAELATHDRRRIGEADLARALLAPRLGIVTEFLIGRHVNPDALRDYVNDTEDEIEEVPEHLAMSLVEIDAELRRRILGQDHVIKQILPWIQRLRERFPRQRGPAAVLLFLGPSGTGKTQLAKEIAHTVYGSEDALLMLEMGQFNARESMNIFIGAPPGYVGYGQGKLTNGLRDKPECVVLFDEVEKAHEDVWVALLRFLDEGLIDDPAGPTRDGRRCIIVLTSNLGADKLGNSGPPAPPAPHQPRNQLRRLSAHGLTGRARRRLFRPPQAVRERPATIVDTAPTAPSPEVTPADAADDTGDLSPALDARIREVVLKYFKRPELYNRVDDKVVFRAFDERVYRNLVERAVDAERRTFDDMYGTRVDVSPAVIDWLRMRALEFHLEGARCIPRLVGRHIVARVLDVVAGRADNPPASVVVELRPDARGTVAREVPDGATSG